MPSALFAAAASAAAAATTSAPTVVAGGGAPFAAPFAGAGAVPLNFSNVGQGYEGIGALSGGGGVTRLLVDYPPALQQQVLDALFLPGAGASLQMIKVEVGGDTQSTEGTEATHERVRGDLNCSRGYEWWILAEAKKRNPAIKTYGLSWGVPGWIGDGSGDGLGYFSADNLRYHVDWLRCASQWGVEIDRMGIWNERSPSGHGDWIIALRKAMDDAGFESTRIVAADLSWDIVTDMLADPALAAAIDIVGAHYPSGPPPATVASVLDKPAWASEMWNLGYVNDWPGAQRLMADLSDHAMWGLSTSIVWCLVYSWYAILPFSHPTPDANVGLGHALLTAAEPWSGHYEVSPQIYTLAHWTQFAAPGWRYLSPASPGMGTLPGNGTYVTVFDPTAAGAGAFNFSVIAQTVAAGAPQDVTFTLGPLPEGVSALPAAVHVWLTTNTSYLQQQPDVPVGPDGSFTLHLPPGAFVTATTTTGQGVFKPTAPVPPSAPFPFPYADNFDGYADQAYAKYFCDEGGIFVAAPLPPALAEAKAAAAATLPGLRASSGSGGAFTQLVTIVPIAWETNPVPYTLLGNFNGGPSQPGLVSWTDYSVTVGAAIDPSAAAGGGVVYDAQLATCGAATQVFTPVSGGGTFGGAPVLLGSVAQPGLCLGLRGPSPLFSGAITLSLVNCTTPGDGASAVAWAYNASGAVVTTGDSGVCLDILRSNGTAGAPIVAYPCNFNTNEQWSVVSSSSGERGAAQQFRLQSRLANKLCVDVAPVPVPPPFVMVSGRIPSYSRGGPPPDGYNLVLSASAPSPSSPGSWRLDYKTTTLAQGATAAPIVPGTWHTLGLAFVGTKITASFDGAVVATVTDTGSSYGMVALGSGWHRAWFDDFAVGNVTAVAA